MIAASHLGTPYAYIYDAVVLTAAAAFLLKDGAERGFRTFEKTLLCVCHLLPVLFFVGLLHSLIAPAAASLLLVMAFRRSVPPPARQDQQAPLPAVRASAA
ncbi:MAG: hypothetical protein ICV73_09565 [Acetobacteraceae bacterium]|nr:hypothetical protein [Acetobacteraceae bacterium]